MKVVSARPGHSSESITSALYTVVVPAVARDAAEQIASVVTLPRTTTEPEEVGEIVLAHHPAGGVPDLRNRRSTGCAARDLNPEPAD